MSVLEKVIRAPLHAAEFANIVLTTDEAAIGTAPREVIWTHRNTTLYRYRSSERRHAVPLLLVFALINRPEIFDLRPGASLVEFLLEEGFDVFLVDWGYPGEEDAGMGMDDYVCDELHWAIRETLRASAAEEVTLVGWCIGATMCAMYCGLEWPQPNPVRNMILLTMPVDARQSTYATWVAREDFDEEAVAETWGLLPGSSVDQANKLLKPISNFITTYRRLWQQVQDGAVRREVYQPMAKWVADNPSFPGRAWAQWIRWMYKEGALPAGRVRMRGRRVDLGRIDQNVLVVTAGADHIAPRAGTMPIFELISSEDVTHLDRPGGHIGLMAGSAAHTDIWPDLAQWLAERSDR